MMKSPNLPCAEKQES